MWGMGGGWLEWESSVVNKEMEGHGYSVVARPWLMGSFFKTAEVPCTIYTVTLFTHDAIALLYM